MLRGIKKLPPYFFQTYPYALLNIHDVYLYMFIRLSRNCSRNFRSAEAIFFEKSVKTNGGLTRKYNDFGYQRTKQGDDVMSATALARAH